MHGTFRWVGAFLIALLLIAISPNICKSSDDISTVVSVQNVAPEILTVTTSKNSLNVTETTLITIVVRDNNSWSDIKEVSITITDAQGLVQVNSKITENISLSLS